MAENVASDVPPLPTAQSGLMSHRSISNSHIPPGPNVRMFSSRGKRPISVDTKTRQASVKTKVEIGGTDYTAYI